MQVRHHGRGPVTKGTVKDGDLTVTGKAFGGGDEGGEPGEMPTWAGSGMEQEWRADAHQCDQVPSADEESRNTLASDQRTR